MKSATARQMLDRHQYGATCLGPCWSRQNFRM